MKSGIYRITNTINGKVYIGSASDLAKRWSRHRTELNRGEHPNKHLQSSWNKYGEASFVHEVIERVEPGKLIEREQFYIDQLLNTGSLYNLAPVAGSNLGLRHTAETRAKVSAATKKAMTAEVRAKIRERMTGRILNPEARQRLRDINTGKRHTPESRKKISEVQKGKVFSEKTRKELRKAKARRRKIQREQAGQLYLAGDS